MPTQGHIKKTLADVQKSYEKCWALLKAVKTGDRSQFSPEAFFDFQPTLCSTLMDVDRLYREIEAKKKALITKKPRLSTSWFKKRMATLAHYQDVLLEVIKIGKFLGDSFAWFFYQKERGYLTEHLACKGQRHLPPGIGGLGEKEFVKNTKAIWGKLVIYHGTTTFLRMGDVSLIDLKSLKLVAIGELKSVQAGPNQMQVRVEFIGPKDRLKPAAEAVAENASGNSSKTDLSPSQRDRLRRQVKKIQEAISKESSREPDAKVSLSATIHADKLEQLVRTSKKRQFTYVQAGDGLVLGAYRTMATSLFGRLAPRNSPNWSQRFGDIGRHVIPIMREGADDNSIYVGSLFYGKQHGPHFILGSVPLFWWPLSPESLYSIIFQEVIIFYLYNPAHLFDRLRGNGFEVIASGPKDWRLKKRIGEMSFVLERFGYFMHLIQQNLFSEEYVIDIVKAAEEQAVRSVKDSEYKSARIDLTIFQQIGERPE